MVSFCRRDISSVSGAKPSGAASDCPFSFSQSIKTDETVLKDVQLFMHRIEYEQRFTHSDTFKLVEQVKLILH